MHRFLRLFLYACAALSAGVALRQVLARWRERRGSEDWKRIATDLGLEYRKEACRADFATARLRLFGEGLRARHQLRGRFEGIETHVFDLVCGESDRRRGYGTAGSQTVVLLRIPAAPWPLFELHPRGLAIWLWVLLGCPGLRFRFREPDLSSRADRRILQRFNRRYYVVVGLTRRIAELAGLDAGVPLGQALSEEREITERFSLSTLQRFAASSGWHVECCSTHIAFWRGGTVPPAQREHHLREAVGLYRSLAAPPSSPADANVEVEVDDLDHAQLGRRLLGLVSGALLGMVLLMLISLPILRLLTLDGIHWFVFAWPLLCLAALAVGAYLGARLAATRNGGF